MTEPLALIERERHVLSQIARGVPLTQVLEDLLRAVEAQSGNTMLTSVLFLREDGQHLSHGAAPSLPAAYNAAIDGIAIGEGVGSCGTVAHRGTPVYANDIETDPLWQDFRDLALSHDLRACWSTPIKAAEGEMLGTFAIYYHTPRSPNREDIEAIAFITQTAALAIERHRSDFDLRRSEKALATLNSDLERQVAERTRERDRTWQLSPDLLGVLNHEGYFEATNPAWQKLLGWSDDEIKRTVFFDLLHPDDLLANRAAFTGIKQGTPVFRFENRYRTKAGDYRWMSWSAVPENGKFYCNARDVTQEKESAALLEERTLERDRAWTLSQELLVIAAPDGTLEAINPMWLTVLGWEAQELLGTKFVDYTHPDDLDRTIEVFTTIFQKPLKDPYEYRFRHKDGSYRWFAWTGSFENGRVYASGRHVTVEREQAEALRQSQKMEAVGQLTGGLAHDFNNLLAGISGSLELMQIRMQQGRLTDVTRYMAAAQGASKRASALTHRLLAFSRRQTLDPKPTDVNRLVSGMQEMIQRTVGPGIPIEVVGASGLWPARVDASQLENALLNLCINARDAMPDGGRITVETGNKWLDERAARQHDMPPGQYLSLCVTDTGTGMPPDVIARVFEPFFTTKPLGEGTGLGLSMIYGFAKQSGGQVRIYSEVGSGTTVCIYLPRHYGDVESDDTGEKTVHLSRSEQGETVLIVDDEPTMRMVVTDILEELGYTALEAGDSAAGLKVLQSDVRIDLLVTDVGLPGGMNGRQMADAGRASRPDLKVLFITGYAENAILGNRHLTPGMAVLTKPFAIEAMAARIRSMIEAGPNRAK